MRRVIALFAVVLVAVAVGCQREGTEVERQIPQPRVTARAGPGEVFAVNGQIVREGATQELPPGEVVGERYTVEINPVVNGSLGRGWLAIVDHGLETTLDEGQLTRFHVDGPGPPISAEEDEQEEAGRGRRYCIGFYSDVASDSAVTSSKTYKCVRCGPVTVCGVNPDCRPQ
jgi:hypothetical protein